ncbi:XtrA/YqaO family protein [Rummeliibacillus sp. POC4]|uniref:XtrA/YqaO family protein n=1 Tax=Rummeliibacillus sp. POC4 TaxID=2305899 RepID=UPI000E6673A7|nr:XtrA/YqaO family protein [Rummeliibacillus sp. POC4]RIJ64156.1 hypothetical protein D1606_11625 [Rummeliibacillus sp. POC4]
MELNDLRIDTNGALYVKAEQLSKNCILIVSNDKAKVMQLPDYATAEVKTCGGKVHQVKCTESKLF